MPIQSVFLYDGQEVFVWSDCLLNLDTDFLVGLCMICVVRAVGRFFGPVQEGIRRPRRSRVSQLWVK